MNRYERVLQILDAAVGGPAVSVGFPHGAFWRGLNREAFVARKVAGVQLITVGNGGGSMLVKALKGESPFGADLPNPPLDATFSRMPAGLDPVPAGEIAFIQQWIDEGCLEDETATAIPLTWRKTNAPVASSRTDDIWFVDRLTGWAVNSDGNILKTTDGGETWAIQLTAPGVYFRCVGFADGNTGWVGTLTRNRRLFRTTDGGANWSRVTNLPANAPVAICGISVVSPQIVYASGTNRPEDFPRVLKTTDGGTTWTAIDMSAHASILIDTFFLGGKLDRKEIVATKAFCQIFGHAAKLVYFGALIDQAASVDPIIAGLAIVSSMIGTSLAKQVLEAMTDQQYRKWANAIIVTIAGYYVVHGTYLMVVSYHAVKAV